MAYKPINMAALYNFFALQRITISTVPLKLIFSSILGSLVLAAIYFLLGIAGLQLAIPPGYASAVFPAAGIGVVAILFGGNRLLPGVWLGSTGINIWIAWTHHSLSEKALLVAAIIALGSTIQATVAAFLVRYRMNDTWRILDNDKDIIRFLMLAGPLGCLISASWGNCTLLLFNFISPAELAFSWWNWWVGDTIGTLLFAPLALLIVHFRNPLWKSRLIHVALPTLAATAGIIAVFVYVSHSESLKFKQRIDEQGLSFANQLQIKLLSYEEIIDSLNNFVRVSPQLTYRDFTKFTERNLKAHPDLLALSWNPLISNQARKQFEAEMTEAYNAPGFRITQLNNQDRLTVADDRDHYVAVRYISPLADNRNALGYDIASEPARLAAIDAAKRSGKTTATAPIHLVQDSSSSAGILLIDPLYPDQPATDQNLPSDQRIPVGFTVGALRVEEMLYRNLTKNLDDNLVYVLEDQDTAEGGKPLYRSGQIPQAHLTGFVWKGDIPFGGRIWHLSVYPTPAYFSGDRSLLAWMVQAGGLALASLFQAFLLALSGRNAVIRRQVNAQTQELSLKEKFLRLSQEGGGVGTWEVDLITHKQAWSENCSTLLGIPTLNESKWEDFLAAVLPEDRQRVIDALQAHIESGDKYDVEYRITDSNGKIRWMRSAGQVERDRTGKPMIMRGIVQDISELKQAEDALRISEAKFRAIIEASPVPYALNDEAQNITYLNTAFVRTFGYTLEDIPTLDSWRLKAYPDPNYRLWVADTWQAKMNQAKQDDVAFEPIEFNIRCKDGQVKIALVGVAKLEGAFSGTHLVILYDISERKAMQKQIADQLSFTQAIIDAEVNALAVCHGILEPPYVRFTVWNPSMEQLTGYSMEEINRLGWYQTVYSAPEVQEKARERMERMRQGDHLHDEEWVITCKNGEQREVLIHTVTAAEDQRGVHILAVMRDITERKSIEHDLRIAAIVFESQQGMLVSGEDNAILRVNRAFTDITGYTAEEVLGKNPRILQSGRQDANFYSAMWESINSTGSWDGEVWNRRKNGEIFPEHLSITAVKDSDGKLANYVATLSDITLSKAAADEIEHLAFYDPLTGLPNRRQLLDRLKPALASSQRSGRNGALLFIDMDNFKTLNDTLGHDLGDLLLQQVAERLKSCVREADTVARLGGDEFVVMLEDLSEHLTEAVEQTEAVGKKILLTLNQPYQLTTYEYHSTPSIGITLFNGNRQGSDELIKQADIAMYQAKTSGRNALRFFDPQMQASINTRVELEAALRQALAENQFKLYYQSQVTHNNQTVGAEVLIRWLHPQRGLISPADFIPLAEETGLILPIGQWVLETACAQIKIWESSDHTRHLQLAVNVSARQFHQADFVEQVLEVLRRTTIKPDRLKLELTESLVLDNIEDTILKMHALREVGVRFSMDDFGTGYSSLSSLKKLPIAQLKIDQSFVRDIANDPDDAVIVQTIIAMANNLDLEIIAEGVETEAQRAFLEEHDCHLCQGYLFGKPMPIEQFESLINTAGAPGKTE